MFVGDKTGTHEEFCREEPVVQTFYKAPCDFLDHGTELLACKSNKLFGPSIVYKILLEI